MRILALLTVLCASLLLTGAWVVARQTTHVITVSQCASEDSQDCYWDAKTQGNHKGSSFLNYDGKTVMITCKPAAEGFYTCAF